MASNEFCNITNVTGLRIQMIYLYIFEEAKKRKIPLDFTQI